MEGSKEGLQCKGEKIDEGVERKNKESEIREKIGWVNKRESSNKAEL